MKLIAICKQELLCDIYGNAIGIIDNSYSYCPDCGKRYPLLEVDFDSNVLFCRVCGHIITGIDYTNFI